MNTLLPTDEETAKWFEENIGIKNDCSASSAIYKFRLWLKERVPAYAEQHRGCGRWVKCKERFPEKDGLYLIVHDAPGSYGRHEMFFKTEDKQWYWQPNPYSVCGHGFITEWLDEQSPCECQQLREENFHLSAEITAVSDGYDRVELKKEIARLENELYNLKHPF